ncbi:hypothetical protein GCM10010182_83380 [Actinomadura cremea]|nr:hypothetical protein GCM10010182_83380 [Actinomadura cremea]
MFNPRSVQLGLGGQAVGGRAPAIRIDRVSGRDSFGIRAQG